jgi:hypothetical protein
MSNIPSSDTPQKRCYSCKNFFPATLEYFYKNRNKKDGFHDACKLCDRARRKAYTEAHREQEHKNRKQYRDSHKQELSARKKIYREAHKEHIAAHKKQWQQGESYKTYQKRYYQEHKEELSQQARANYLAHQEERLECQRLYLRTVQGRMVDKAHKQKRKAQKRASAGSYTAKQLQEQVKRQKSKCYYCKTKLPEIYHVDHIVPLARGGSNDISNIVVTCPTCNMSKSYKLLHEWIEGGRLL